MTEDNFQWTDELVLAFARFTYSESPTFQGRYADLRQFKEDYTKPKVEWEIVSVMFRGSTFTKDGNPYSILAINDFVKRGATIKSVKRLKDGELFCVGDVLEYGSLSVGGAAKYNWGDIVEFIIDKGSVFTKVGGEILHYTIWQKATKPIALFTTEDGVELFSKNDRLFAVLSKGTWQLADWTVGYIGFHPKGDAWKYFSTHEKREEYILTNKPILSVNDVYGIVKKGEMSDKDYVVWSAFVNTDLKELAKSKLNK
jgi:hypothetical protein